MDAFKKSRMHHRIARASPLPHRSRVPLASPLARTDDGVFTVPPSPREFSFAGVDIVAVSRVVVSRPFSSPQRLSLRARTLVYEIPENHLCVRDTCTYSKRHMIEECKKAHARAHSNSTEMGLSRAEYASRVLDAVGRTRRGRARGERVPSPMVARARVFASRRARRRRSMGVVGAVDAVDGGRARGGGVWTSRAS